MMWFLLYIEVQTVTPRVGFLLVYACCLFMFHVRYTYFYFVLISDISVYQVPILYKLFESLIHYIWNVHAQLSSKFMHLLLRFFNIMLMKIMGITKYHYCFSKKIPAYVNQEQTRAPNFVDEICKHEKTRKEVALRRLALGPTKSPQMTKAVFVKIKIVIVLGFLRVSPFIIVHWLFI